MDLAIARRAHSRRDLAPTPRSHTGALVRGGASTAGDANFAFIWPLAGATLGAYLGYTRNNSSMGWAIGGGLLGGFFWPLALPVGAAIYLASRKG